MQICGNNPGQSGPRDVTQGVQSNMTMLITTIFAAFIGPLASHLMGAQARYRWRRSPFPDGKSGAHSASSKTHLWTHRCALALMLGTLAVNVIPFNFRALGWTSLILSALAWVLVVTLLWGVNQLRTPDPALLSRERLSLVVVTMSGLLVHSLADGAALYSFGEQAPLTWGPALFLDRVAVGFFVWTLIRDTPLPKDLETYRETLAWGSVVFLCGATLLGYFLMQYVIRIVAEPQFLALVQSALVGIIVPLMTGKLSDASIHPTREKSPQTI